MGGVYKHYERKKIMPVDTYYLGNYFRSRLEARWAYFFDVLKINYVYEPDGYLLSTAPRVIYLPDFFLPEFNCFAEVKPDLAGIYKRKWNSLDEMLATMPAGDYHKWILFSKLLQRLVLLVGNPHDQPLPTIFNDRWQLMNFQMNPKQIDFISSDDFHLHNPHLMSFVPLANMKRFDHGL